MGRVWSRIKHMGTFTPHDELKRKNQIMGKVQTQTTQATRKYQRTLRHWPQLLEKEKTEIRPNQRFRGHQKLLQPLQKFIKILSLRQKRKKYWSGKWIEGKNHKRFRSSRCQEDYQTKEDWKKEKRTLIVRAKAQIPPKGLVKIHIKRRWSYQDSKPKD